MGSAGKIAAAVPASSTQAMFLAGADRGRCNAKLLLLIRFGGDLDRDAMTRAIAALADRHEALRTTLRMSPTRGPEQVIWETVLDTLDELDLSASPEAFDEQVVAFIEEPFQLDGGHLWNARLVRLGSSEHVLVLGLHHVICDGRSLPVLRSDLYELYASYATGRPSSLVPLLVQPRDFAAREAAMATPAVQEYWRRHLVPRASASSHVFREQVAQPRLFEFYSLPLIDQPTLAAFDELLAHARSTRAIGMLAGLGAMFVGADEELMAGIVYAHRDRSEFDAVVGFLASHLPTIIDLRRSPSFGDLVTRTQSAWIHALANRLPIARIGQIVGYDRLVDPLPLYDFGLNYITNDAQDVPFVVEGRSLTVLSEKEFDEMQLREHLGRAAAMMGYEVVIIEDADRVPVGFVGVQEGTASEAEVAAFGQRWSRLLERMVAEPDRPVESLLGDHA